uniref:Calcium-dependent protein kinase 1 n=1 Tax=Albugo laibachii Nc14 TaxID=890382 RepID=F0WZ59_9STRA|nr:predicted protein putative [Albugo laibachii Nc14]|eukprot:CCA26775.1 predicted protein putative [Albugo laibachii Nc14]
MGNGGSNARPHKQYRYSGARKAKKNAEQGHAPPLYRSSAPSARAPAPAVDTRRTAEKKPTRTVQNRLITGALRDINEFYSIEKTEIGHGSFGTVRVGTDRSTGQTVAIKTILKFQISQPDVMQSDFRILRSFDHPNIIKLYDVCEGPRHLHIITELCTGGELFDRIIARGHFSEADAATLIRKILNAVAHCHDRGICHRDLKPENCLFETNAEDADLKVIDFGLSCMDNSVTGENVMKTRVGSIYYVAPEVLKGRYDKSCDLWSIGVIVYILLCGYPPFYGDTDSDVFEAVISGKFEFDTAEWSAVSDAAKEFIRSLLVVNPTKRLTASDALRHPWLSGEAPLTQIGLSSEILLSPKRFTGHNKLKKAALEGMADQMT